MHYSLRADRVRAAFRRIVGVAALGMVAGLGLFQSAAHAAQFTLAWDYGASGATGFAVYCGTSSGSYTSRYDAGNALSYTVTNVADGSRLFCAVSAYDSARVESPRSSEITVQIPYKAPVVGFSASPLSGTAPLNVAFSNSTTGTVTSWLWNFGDGTSSTAQNPTHVYSAAGTYFATLTATGPGGSNSLTSSTAIRVTTGTTTAAPVASFSASQLSGTAPLLVTFTNTTTGTVSTWNWDFGDGTSSTAQNPTHTYSVAGNYYVRLTATGSGGSSTFTASSPISVTSPVTSTKTTGLLLAYGFEEGSGTTVADRSGRQNKGTVSNATWTTAGRYGKALLFNGRNSLVTAKDSITLDLTAAMTIEAWVYPTTTSLGWATVIMKEDLRGAAYYLYGGSSSGAPFAGVFINGEKNVSGTARLPANTWSHLAATYDGQTERLYVNGTLVAQRAQTGRIAVTSGALRVGGNSLWGEYFTGRIDEVRIYNRALSAAQIATDMQTPVGP